jgi:hypothetical protein
MGLASHLRTTMRTYEAKLHVGYGSWIVAGYNDKLDIDVSGTPYTATLDEREWSCIDLAEHIEGKLNALGTGLTFTCSYSDTTNAFTISAGSAFTVKASTGANELTSAWPLLGFPSDQGPATSHTGSFARYYGRFWIVCRTGTISLLWKTGASATTNASLTLGWSRAADVATFTNATATFQVGNREVRCAASVASDGARGEQTFEAEYVRTEGAATDLRNRLTDFSLAPQPPIEIACFGFPDAQPMRIFETDEALGELIAFAIYGQPGTAGSWAGRKFRMQEVELGAGPWWGQRIVAVAA